MGGVEVGGLRRVDAGAAAHGDVGVEAPLGGDADGLAEGGVRGLHVDAVEELVLDPGVVEGLAGRGHRLQAGDLRVGDQQRPPGAHVGQVHADLRGDPGAAADAGGGHLEGGVAFHGDPQEPAGASAPAAASNSSTSRRLPMTRGTRSCRVARHPLEDRTAAVGGGAAGLLDDEGEGVRLVEQAQLAAGGLAVGGIEEDAALEQVAVEVGDQGADVARRAAPLLAAVHVGAHGAAPAAGVALVGAVDGPPLRDADALVGEQELADRRVEGEAVDAAAGGVDEHGARPVDEVPGAQLLAARPQEARGGGVGRAGRAVDGEDRADADVHVDVGGAVHGVEDEDVGAPGVGLRDRVEVLHLLRGHGRQQPRVVEGLDDGGVGELVELLHLLAVDVGAAREAHGLGEARLVHLAADDLGRGGDPLQQGGEAARDPGEVALLLDDEPGQGHAQHRGRLLEGGCGPQSTSCPAGRPACAPAGAPVHCPPMARHRRSLLSLNHFARGA